MELQCACRDITLEEWEELMKDKKPLNYKWLVSKIKKHIPRLYDELALGVYNPYQGQCYKTKTHYILTHSSVEYFIKK